ncbi:MAG: cytochrome c [Rhodoferax sp.]
MSSVLRLGILIAAVLSMTTGCMKPTPDLHPNQVLTKRKALFKQFSHTLEPMGMVTSDRSDYVPAEFLVNAEDLQKLSTKPWVFFPADGNYAPTHARPSVWSYPKEFKAAQDKYIQSVSQLVSAAKSQNLDQIKQSYYDVTNSCKACHRNFRYN